VLPPQPKPRAQSIPNSERHVLSASDEQEAIAVPCSLLGLSTTRSLAVFWHKVNQHVPFFPRVKFLPYTKDTTGLSPHWDSTGTAWFADVALSVTDQPIAGNFVLPLSKGSREIAARSPALRPTRAESRFSRMQCVLALPIARSDHICTHRAAPYLKRVKRMS
jgi:hypothetical protein